MSDAILVPEPMPRRLSYRPPKARADEIIEQDGVASLSGPIIVLGDPGIGKSFLAKALSSPGSPYVRAGTFHRAADPKTYLPGIGGRLIIDGLDEIASAAPGGGIHDILRQLSTMGYPPFVLLSREADWNGAAARVQIEDDYGAAATLLHLLPFDRDDAATFLTRYFKQVDAALVLDHLASHGLEEIYRNPLTLRMIGEVAEAEQALPATRSALLEKACALMLVEENQRHHGAVHTQLAAQNLLLCAGAVAATLLLCDRMAVVTAPAAATAANCVHLSAITRLPLAALAGEALKTRLFQAEDECRFVPSHRVVAEFLAARWLAACVEAGASKLRVLGLLTLGAGVPTSLRGVSAWLAHFSALLAPDCIDADSYAVLRYGDAETMPLDQARLLLTALTKLSDTDPYFRKRGVGSRAAAGLLRVELKDQVIALISNDLVNSTLALMLLEGLDGSPLLPVIEGRIEEILLDPDASAASRLRALQALSFGGRLRAPARLVNALLDRGDAQSNVSAFRLLDYGQIDAVPPWLAVRAVLASAGVTVSPLPHTEEDDDNGPYIRSDLFAGADAAFVRAFLDELTDCAAPLLTDADRDDREAAINVTRLAVLRLMAIDPTVEGGDVWRWLAWTGGYTVFDKKPDDTLCEQFAAHPDLVQAIHKEIIFNTPLDEMRLVMWSLHRVNRGLVLENPQLIALMQAYVAASGDEVDPERLKAMALLARTKEGLPEEVSQAAVSLAGGKKSFARALAAQSKPFKDPYAAKAAKQQAEAAKARDAKYETIRTVHRKHLEEIREGHFGHLEQDARVYLGRFYEFDKKLQPMERLEVFLGEQLAEDVAQGFMAALDREDRPSAADIATAHAKGRHFLIEVSMVCGVVERLRRGRDLQLPQVTLEAAHMAWRRQHESNILNSLNIGGPLEAATLTDDAAVERFFRTSIEPQLTTPRDHIEDLYKLTHEAQWQSLAGRLACEWLMAHPNLSPSVEAELLDCALRYAEPALIEPLVNWSRTRVHSTVESLLIWLSADFLVDFDRGRPYLAEAAHHEADLLWRLRSRSLRERDGAWPTLSLAQYALVVEAFSPLWPYVRRPSGATSGDTNPWDATEFITGAIYRLAADPTPQATEILAALIDGPDHGYRPDLRHALAEQRKLRRDQEYTPATPDALLAVFDNGPPDSIDDMRAFFGERVLEVSARMHTTNTDMWDAYWDGDKPRDENHCRNRLIEHISAALPKAVRFEPEMHMPNQKRADIAAIRDAIGLPVEIKGQWHAQVWDAVTEQLAARYARDWHAEGRGVFIVIWFGDAKGKRLTAHPDGLARPTTPEALRMMLLERIPEQSRDLFDVYVVDVSRPAETP